MSVTIKSESEIEKMRVAGKMLAIVHDEVRKLIKPGVSTYDLDKKAYDVIISLGAKPNFLHLYGYPATICASVNEVVVHGIPDKNTVLREGDIIGIDMGLIYDGFHSDAARTYGVGAISEEKQKLIEVTKGSFFAGIKSATAGNHLYDISKAIEDYVKPYRYGIVRDMVGHGIGRKLHEDPEIPNYVTAPLENPDLKPHGKGILLKPGMTLAIEPMINLGTWEIYIEDDEWTCKTLDHKPSAHYENTILITEGEPEVLTLYRDGKEV